MRRFLCSRNDQLLSQLVPNTLGAPGETKTVQFALPADELAFVGADGKWRLEAGDFRISCGGLGQLVKCTETYIWNTPNK